MAHLVETMAYAGETPWHGLGERVDSNLTPAEMLKAAQLDWKVEKHPTFIKLGNVTKQTGEYALVRDTDSKILSTVSKDWKPFQNEQAFEFFNDFIKAGDMEMHTAGSLKGGRIVWALAKVKESFNLFGGDEVESFLLFTNPHQFGKAIDVRFTPIRVVCNNTLTYALNKDVDKLARVNHRVKFDADVVKETLGIAHNKMGEYKEIAEFLGSEKATKKELEQFFAQVFPPIYKVKEKDLTKDFSKNAELAMEIIETQPGANFAKGTWWSAYNTVTYMTDHVLGKSADTRLASAWYGTNQQRKLVALNKAIEFAKA